MAYLQIKQQCLGAVSRSSITKLYISSLKIAFYLCLISVNTLLRALFSYDKQNSISLHVSVLIFLMSHFEHYLQTFADAP